MAAKPDEAMMAAPRMLAQFLETGDQELLDGLFSDGDVTILENFAPHLFSGQAGLSQWRAQMLDHVGGIQDLRHRFGEPQDFAETKDSVFFTVPTDWGGVQDGKIFVEHGGWTFLLVPEEGRWRIRSYAWSVVRFDKQGQP